MSTATNKPVGLSDTVLKTFSSFLSFFTWSLVGLAKSLSNHPSTRQDRWIILFVSLAGLAALSLMALFAYWMMTDWRWAVALGLTAIAYCVLAVVHFALDVPAPADTYRAFG